MNERDDYLWDRSGTPDDDVAALEDALRPLARGDRPYVGRGPRPWIPLAAAALVLVGVGVVLFGQPQQQAPEVPAVPVTDVSAGAPVAPDTWLTPESSSIELAVGDLGRVTVDPGSRLQVRRAAQDVTRFFLERGRIEARVSADARPRFFQVDTPATRCVDLGCRYTLEVDPAGNALVRVTLGQVAFENEGREVYVPAGAECRAARGMGAGTPRWQDATPPLVAALDRFDAASRAPAAERESLAATVITECPEPRDTLPLWHLLQDPDDHVAIAAGAALARLSGRPPDLDSPAGRRPAPGDVALWKAHLLSDWR